MKKMKKKKFCFNILMGFFWKIYMGFFFIRKLIMFKNDYDNLFFLDICVFECFFFLLDL